MELMLKLNAVELRVLGCLIEKEITTPEYYPLTLNALVNACNQKSSRDPVMEVEEDQVREALGELEQMGLVRVQQESRSTKFEHLTYHKLDLRRPEIAALGLLLLRGPQTAGEIRTRSERLYSFDDPGAVLTVLERLAAREEPLTVQLPRQPGAREARWAHLLGGEVELTAPSPVQEAQPVAVPAFDAAELEQRLAERIAGLEAEVRGLNERLAALEEALR